MIAHSQLTAATELRRTNPRVRNDFVVATPLGNEPLCSAQSPDGKHECSLPANHHEDAHTAICPRVKWVQLTEFDVAVYGDGKPGDWVTDDESPEEERCFVVATWPRRPDDFTPTGEVTDRSDEWRRHTYEHP